MNSRHYFVRHISYFATITGCSRKYFVVYLESSRHWALTVSRPSAGALRHSRLTDSPARTDLVLFIHRTVRLIILHVADLVKRISC